MEKLLEKINQRKSNKKKYQEKKFTEKNIGNGNFFEFVVLTSPENHLQ